MRPGTDVERQLLAAARGGDAAALGELMERFRAYLLSIAGQELVETVRAKEAPSDVVQNTFLEAHRLFERFQGGEAAEFRAWLRAILLNKVAECHTHYLTVQKRHVGREQSLDESGEGGPLRDRLADELATPSGLAVRKEESQAVAAALTRLPEAARRIIVWRNWEGLPFAEIGARLGRSEDAARMAFGRALEQLALELDRDHDPRPDTPA